MALVHTPDFPHLGAACGFRQTLQALHNGDADCRDSVPTFMRDQRFNLNWAQLFDEVDAARARGQTIRPAIIGPLTYLWLGRVEGEHFDKLDLLDRLLPVYGEILGRLAGKGVEWVQIDEPILTLDLPQDWKSAFERAYHALQYSPLKKLLAVSNGGLGLGGNLGLTVCLPVQGLHVDALSAPEQLPLVLDRLPIYKVLSLGLVDEAQASGSRLEAALEMVKEAQLRFAENLWVAGPPAVAA